MGRTYSATGINLKAVPMGETDRLVTILTVESGLVRVVAPGSRKHQSKLGGRSGLFVINSLLIAKGKQLDKWIQAETVRSFPGLSQHLGRLTASQYLAEMALFEALTEQPQPELFHLLVEHLERIETCSPASVLPCLVHGIYHLLALAGVAPNVQSCCVTRDPVVPNLIDSDWRVGFSIQAGGIFGLDQLQRLAAGAATRVAEDQGIAVAGLFDKPVSEGYRASSQRRGESVTQLSGIDLAVLQQLSRPDLIVTDTSLPTALSASVQTCHPAWSRIERLLRQYAQYHFDRPIRSAALVDACFSAV